MTNLRFAYMYRDASNYKQHGEAIFSNEKQLAVDEVEKQIRACLNDGEYFIARQIHIEERFFDARGDVRIQPTCLGVGGQRCLVEPAIAAGVDETSEQLRVVAVAPSFIEQAHQCS